MIKNVIFDIGNVLIKWDPASIVANFFPDHQDHLALAKSIFKSEIWYDLNFGKLSMNEAIASYNTTIGLEVKILEELMNKMLESLVTIDESVELLKKLHALKVPLYSITDNVREIIEYEKSKYDFLDLFIDIITSYDTNVLKPNSAIYEHLLQKHSLIAAECVFIDDHLPNVEGAIKVGMKAIHFTDAATCKTELIRLGILC
jgi:putative hydrolase of the HAD superfamily